MYVFLMNLFQSRSMAVAILQQPDPISLSRNQIVYKIQANDAFGNIYGPKAATAELNSTADGYPVNSTIEVEWTNPDGTTSSVTFTAVATPTTDNHILASISTQTITYFETVAAQISAHPSISPFLTVTATDEDPVFTLNFTATDTYESISITITPTGITGSSTTSTDAVADNTPDNYRVIAELFFENNDGLFESKLTISEKPDNFGVIAFDLADDIHKLLKDSFDSPPIPAFDNNDPLQANILKKFYIRYREDYDGFTAVWLESSIRKAMCGGLLKQTFATRDFFSSFHEGNSFLTWYPDGKSISVNQPEYLAWYNYTGAQQVVYLEVTMVEEDGTDTVIRKYQSLILTIPAEEVYLFPCGYNQLGLSDEGLNIKKYSVRVALSEDPIPVTTTYLSQGRSYYVDPVYYHDERFIVYLNGFCVPETLRCLGIKDTFLEVQRQEAEQILPINYQELDAEYKQYDVSFFHPYIYRSGYLSKAEVEALQELLIYNDSYEVRQDGYLPLRITDNRYSIFTSRQFLHSIQFRSRSRYSEKAYSNSNMILVDPSAEPDFWNTGEDNWWGDNSEPWST